MTQQEQYDNIMRELNSLKEGQKTTDEKVDKVNAAVIGDRYGNKGLIKRVIELETYKDTDKSLKSRVIGGFAVVTVLLSFVIQGLMELFKHIFK